MNDVRWDRRGHGFLQGEHDPADFALRLRHKHVGLGREAGVPMRLANMAYEELTEAMNRGWGARSSSVGQLLQVDAAIRSRVHPRNPRRRQEAEVSRVRRIIGLLR